MSPFRVFVTRHVYPRAIELLSSCADVTYHDSRDGLSRGELTAKVADQDAILCQLTDSIDAAVLDAGKELSIVANVAVGYDNIDVAAATRRGILVTNTPFVLTESTNSHGPAGKRARFLLSLLGLSFFRWLSILIILSMREQTLDCINSPPPQSHSPHPPISVPPRHPNHS